MPKVSGKFLKLSVPIKGTIGRKYIQFVINPNMSYQHILIDGKYRFRIKFYIISIVNVY